VRHSAMIALLGALAVVIGSTATAIAAPADASSAPLTVQTPRLPPQNVALPRSAQPRGAAIVPITGALIPHHGGAVETAPHLYIDFWGWTSDPAGVQPYLTSFLSSIGNTEWIKVLEQYGTGTRPILKGSWSDPASVPLAPTIAEIQAEAVRAAAQFGLSSSVNDQIIVATPTGHVPVGFYSPSNPNGYCGEHLAVTSMPKLTYTILPYMPDAGSACGLGTVNPSSQLDGVSIIAGHELAESMTDPLANAWYDAGGNEVGDKCLWFDSQNITTSLGTFAVQPLWSNTANGCSVKPAWSVTEVSGSTTNRGLGGVSCLSVTSCMAVGFYLSNVSFTNQTLVMPWVGYAWGNGFSPNSSPYEPNILSGVSCVSATFCMAVGFHDSGVTLRGQTLVESWNGATWSIVPSPSPGAWDNVLTSVSCVSASSCTAVGYVNYSGSTRQTLVESWNGATWSVVSTPNLAGQNTLGSVSCVSINSCMTVGSYGVTVNQTLVESWNGMVWSVVPSPNNGRYDNQLLSVTCLPSRTCVAVGNDSNGTSQSSTLVESFNGTTWSIVSSPNVGSRSNSLEGVSCVSLISCTAVGFYLNASGYNRTLIESFQGTGWSIVASPNVGSGSNSLAGVSCVNSQSCIAAGTSQGSSAWQSLIESHG
jgi:hypothetical protein